MVTCWLIQFEFFSSSMHLFLLVITCNLVVYHLLAKNSHKFDSFCIELIKIWKSNKIQNSWLDVPRYFFSATKNSKQILLNQWIERVGNFNNIFLLVLESIGGDLLKLLQNTYYAYSKACNFPATKYLNNCKSFIWNQMIFWYI